MSYIDKKSAGNQIKTRAIKRLNGSYNIYEVYLGTNPYTRKPVRLTARTGEKLKQKIDDFYRRLTVGGDAAVVLSAYQSLDARNALDMLSRSGLMIPLTECVRRVIESAGNADGCTTALGDAYARYLDAQIGKSADHQKAVRSRVGKFVETFGADRLVSDVTARETSENLEKRLYDPANPKSKTTFNNHLGYVKTFMEWCAAPEQAFVKESPVASMKPKAKEWKDPEFMKAADAEKLFRALESRKSDAPADLADAILSFFCGMRQAEIARVREGEGAVRVSLENRNIRIVKCKGSLKGVKPRSFTIPDAALAWMRSFDFTSAVMQPNAKFREHLRAVAKEAGVSLPKNAGRHTFITMHAAAYHDQSLLTSVAGNSEDVRGQHYDGLTFEDEGKAYFAIAPTASAPQ